ncbi:DUF1206 domain-containing protein [Polaribacter porphyrae]|uniref:DUF1206 domain-containing protein n=1 Tax=Polaribacter porphyrae TaxID=1137780 RepID=A0A2S7WLE2_9FLAO|nr:DUF1206 domain-containing protein [Polaribacter porphyrae]PQJ78131.1 hypothetical protein BTO18_02500 [Polaribacter porphyrae]
MLETIRKIGIITKGIIYTLVGLLTLLASLNLGGKISGKDGVINFLEEQNFGQVIVLALGVGLIMYALWKMYAAFWDGKNEGSSKKGILIRIGYFISGLIYGALASSVLFSSVSSTSGNTRTEAVKTLLQQDSGVLALYLIGIILFFVGIYQFYKGYSGKFLEDIENVRNIESKDILKKSGKYGHMARGVSFTLFAFFVFVAASQKNAQAIKGLKDMFNFLQNFSWGNILMGIMALGFVFYGLYQYFLAKYSSLY